jgi:dienelactone hydrolase
MNRNLSVNAYFRSLAAKHTPKFSFSKNSRDDWSKWKDQLLASIKGTLGKMPEKVPLNHQIIAEWKEDGLIKQKIVFDVEDGLSATAYVFRPVYTKNKLPAILACHGHGPFGKESVMGNCSTPELRDNIEQHNYDYGLQMAKAGYVVIAIDWRGFGERDDRRKPNWNDNVHGFDICNAHYIRANILGMTVLGMNIHDGICALDYLCELDFVDTDHIGAMGLSFGGTMTTWITLCDERIKAADIICYSDRFEYFGMRDNNFCGSQITPNLYDLCDLPDLQGLIAPRPLLVEIGIFDECFKIESAMSCFDETKRIYAAAGCCDKLELDLFESGHQWSGRKSLQFFKKHL